MTHELKSQYFTTNGIQLHCKVAGDKNQPLVLFLHGFPEFWYSWHKQLPFFAEKYYVVAPDLRGYNLSDKPKGVANYQMKELVADVKGLIEALGYQQAKVVAHDWGGAIAWTLAGHHPELVERLAILNMPHPSIFMDSLYKKINIKQWLRSWYVAFFQLPFLPEWTIQFKPERFFKNSFQGWVHRAEAFTDEDIQQYVQAFSNPATPTAAINYYRAAFRYPSKADQEALKQIEVPVTMIWGENDKALGKELTYDTEKYCPQFYGIHYIPNCSHWVQSEYPKLVNKYLDQLLKRSL